MKFIVAISVVSQLADFKSVGGAPLVQNNFVIGNNRQLLKSTQMDGELENLHDESLLSITGGAPISDRVWVNISCS